MSPGSVQDTQGQATHGSRQNFRVLAVWAAPGLILQPRGLKTAVEGLEARRRPTPTPKPRVSLGMRGSRSSWRS